MIFQNILIAKKLNRQELFNNLINNPENEFEEIINILFQYLFPISLCENLFLKQRFEKTFKYYNWYSNYK